MSTFNDALAKVDLVLVMSVHPGFGGQKFISDSLEKVRYLKDMREKNNYNYLIEIDGGIYADNVKDVIDAGVDIVVSGSGVFKNDIRENIKKFKNILEG